MNYLLGVTIGPVQTYIEESRKLIDLKNSSNLISSIMKKIYELIPDNAEKELIYPNHITFDEDVDFSNYMVIEIKNIVEMRKIEKESFDYFDNFLRKIDPKFSIKDIFNLFWAIEEIDDSKNGYRLAYKELTRNIRSLKNTYEFKQQEQQGNREKCLICGKYNVSKVENRNSYNLSINESLCPLCLFKRKGGWNKESKDDRKFESVYSLALMKWKEKNKNAIKEVTDQLNQIFKKNIDKYYGLNEIISIINLLKSNYEGKKYEELKDDIKDKNLSNGEYIKKFENIKKCMSNLYDKKIEKSDVIIKSPVYEYCFIQFDVDNLGKWISGKYIDSDSDIGLKSFQKDLSKTLIEFGKSLKTKLSDGSSCEIIYSGGDDFLGVLPNEEIISVSKTIDKLFKEKVQNKIRSQYKKIDNDITYSMSITIAQCKDPMSYALSKTRIELENVKKRFESIQAEKNGVSITYIINNGKEITCYLTKNEFKKLFYLIKNLKFVKENVLFSYINKFENEFIKFNNNEISFEDARDFYNITNCEFKRLLLKSKIKNKEKDNKIDKYIKYLSEFMDEIINKNIVEIKSNHENIDFKNIMNVMKVNKKLSNIDFVSKGCESEENYELNKFETM